MPDSTPLRQSRAVQVTEMSEKLAGRSTDDLMKSYRELSTTVGPDAQKALEIMRRLAEANNQVAAMCQVVSALHGECSADTLEESITEARQAGLALPPAVDRMCVARKLLGHSAAGRWAELLDMLQGQCVKSLYDKDADGLLDFQFCSLKTCVQKFLNQEVLLPKPADQATGSDKKEGDEKAKEQEALKLKQASN